MWTPDWRFILVGLGMLLFITLAPASQDPAELERELDALRAQIDQIQGRLDADLAQRDERLSALAESERALAAAERARRTTSDALARTEANLIDLEDRIRRAEGERAELSARLARQLHLAYRQGSPSRLQLLLNQDDPRRVSRQLAYHAHIAHARLDLIADLRVVVDTLAEDRQQLDDEREELETLSQRQRLEAENIERERLARDQALARLEARIVESSDRIESLRQDAAELEQLIEELARALRDIPMDLEVPSILDLKGDLPLPLPGRLIRRYGDPRGGEVNWTGWLLETAPGTEVRAIAHGRVAYADWLRGYGMLTIVDHGDGVMSLYGHNESLVHEVGAWVQPGEVIATAGRSGGADEDALYFELRQDGQPVNPADWLANP